MEICQCECKNFQKCKKNKIVAIQANAFVKTASILKVLPMNQ